MAVAEEHLLFQNCGGAGRIEVDGPIQLHIVHGRAHVDFGPLLGEELGVNPVQLPCLGDLGHHQTGDVAADHKVPDLCNLGQFLVLHTAHLTGDHVFAVFRFGDGAELQQKDQNLVVVLLGVFLEGVGDQNGVRVPLQQCLDGVLMVDVTGLQTDLNILVGGVYHVLHGLPVLLLHGHQNLGAGGQILVLLPEYFPQPGTIAQNEHFPPLGGAVVRRVHDGVFLHRAGLGQRDADAPLLLQENHPVPLFHTGFSGGIEQNLAVLFDADDCGFREIPVQLGHAEPPHLGNRLQINLVALKGQQFGIDGGQTGLAAGLGHNPGHGVVEENNLGLIFPGQLGGLVVLPVLNHRGEKRLGVVGFFEQSRHRQNGFDGGEVVFGVDDDAFGVLRGADLQVGHIGDIAAAADHFDLVGVGDALVDGVLHLLLFQAVVHHHHHVFFMVAVGLNQLFQNDKEVAVVSQNDDVVFLQYTGFSLAEGGHFLLHAGVDNTDEHAGDEETADGHQRHEQHKQHTAGVGGQGTGVNGVHQTQPDASGDGEAALPVKQHIDHAHQDHHQRGDGEENAHHGDGALGHDAVKGVLHALFQGKGPFSRLLGFFHGCTPPHI